MFKVIIKNFLLVILFSIINKQAVAITGEEIISKVSQWLTKEGIKGTPVFSKNSLYRDCNNEIEIKKMFQNYKTLKDSCLDDKGLKIELDKDKQIFGFVKKSNFNFCVG